MTIAQVLSLENNSFALKGAVTFYTAPALCAELQQLLPKTESVTVELNQITQCDSASIVVLLQILRQATHNEQKIQFLNIPPKMQVLIELYDLTTVFNNKQ